MIDSLQAFDRSLFLFINSLHLEWLNPLMVFFSGGLIWLPLMVAPLWMAYRSLDKKYFFLFFLFLLLAIIASDVTSSYIFKNIFNRMRPCRIAELKDLVYDFGQKCGGKFGFVSSHASNSIALAVFSLRSLSFKKSYAILIIALPLIISYSRVYLGVHYPGDILGGAMIGVFWALMMSWCFKRVGNSGSKSR
jgi:undecaprenyl-diphosphatase